jgi:alpha-1,3-rhamnosyl/mannosyltransferase
VSTPLRIGLDLSCTAETPLTGIGYAALHQVHALIKRECALKVFAAGGVDARELIANHFQDIENKRVYPRARLAKYYAWTRLQWPPMEWFCGDIDIAHNLCHALPATSKAQRVVTVHDLSVFRHPETHTPRTVDVQTRLLRQSVAKADHLIAVSAFTKQELIDVLDAEPDSITVVPNGVNIDEFQCETDEDALRAIRNQLGLNGRYLMYLGSIEPRKNVVRMIEAYAQLRDRLTECPKLLIAGNPAWGSAPALEAIELNTKNADIIQAGYLDRSDVIALLRNATACVYPSLYEGFGLPVLEAMVAETPVIASDTPAIAEVADGAAMLVPPEDTGALSEAMHDTIEQPSTDRVNRGLDRARELTWDHSAEKLDACYQHVANRGMM